MWWIRRGESCGLYIGVKEEGIRVDGGKGGICVNGLEGRGVSYVWMEKRKASIYPGLNYIGEQRPDNPVLLIL